MDLVVIGGSDAGISAALRALELDAGVAATVVVADAYPNFSVCGIPYFVSGEVADWRSLAHRSVAELEATGMRLRLGTRAVRIDAAERRVEVSRPSGEAELLHYDELVVATGAAPVVPPVDGLSGPGALGPGEGVHLLRSMDDTFAVMATLERDSTSSAVIVGGGYIGLEMAEALVARGLEVTMVERLGEVLPTVDAGVGAHVREQLTNNGVKVLTGTAVTSVGRAGEGSEAIVEVVASTDEGFETRLRADIVLVVTGVRPDTALGVSAGARLGAGRAIAVDEEMRTGVPGVLAAGDCVVTHHRLLGEVWLPLGTTAHKQGRVAGENALGARRRFAGSLGTQVVKVFDHAVARTGLRDDEAAAAGFAPLTVAFEADDHKAYYPGSHRLSIHVTGDRRSGQLLGVQLFGHRDASVAKRIDTAAAAIFNGMSVESVSDLDLSYTPPLGSPWDALQLGAQAWSRVAT